MDSITVVTIGPKDEREQMTLRIPSGLKSWVEGKALELGYNTNEYVTAIFTAMMGEDYE